MTPLCCWPSGARRASKGAGTEDNQEVGVDAKWSMTPSMTLDATVNTDFAQVEVDELQINLDRFNLFFPRKRPSSSRTPATSLLAYRRSWSCSTAVASGSGPTARSCRSTGACECPARRPTSTTSARSTCRPTKSPGVAPQNDFAVARVSRDLPNRSSIGGLFASRQGSGREAPRTTRP